MSSRDTRGAMLVREPTTLVAACLVFVAFTCAQDCSQPVADKCFCGDEVHSDETLKVVRCSGLSPEEMLELRRLPADVEMLYVRGSDLEDFSLGGLKFLPPTLRILRLENNQINDLDLKEFLCSHPNLEEVFLNDNTMLWLTIDPKCSPRLRVLGLRQNHIHFLPNQTLIALNQMDNLKLDLSDNTFSCDCNLAPTLQWFQQKVAGGKGATLVNPELYLCRDGFPEELTGRHVMDLYPDLLKCEGEGNDQVVTEDYSKHSSYIIFYAMIGFVVVMSLVIGLFALYLNFHSIVRSVRGLQKATTVSRTKHYVTLHETEA